MLQAFHTPPQKYTLKASMLKPLRSPAVKTFEFSITFPKLT